MEPPDTLSDRAAALWLRLIDDLTVVGGGSQGDLLVLEESLILYDRLLSVREELQASNVTIKGSTGQLRVNPLIQEETKLSAEIKRGLNSLCLTLSSRPDWVKVGPDRGLHVPPAAPGSERALMESMQPGSDHS